MEATIKSTDEEIREAKANGHRMGTWHWVDACTVQSRCVCCNAGIRVGGPTEVVGLDQPCLVELATGQGLIIGDASGGMITYD